MSRRKGSTLERDVVNMAREYGLTAERTAPMQGVGRSGGADVLIEGTIKVECKSHARISGWTQILTAIMLGATCPLTKEQVAWLDDMDWLVLKQTGWPEPVVILPHETGYYLPYILRNWLIVQRDRKLHG